jgi:hypothetical protein
LAKAGTAAQIEASLLEARLLSDEGNSVRVEEVLLAAEELLDEPELLATDRLCYRARVFDQLAYQLLHPANGQPRLIEALERYRAIPENASVPFVAFRRAAGLAYCQWKLGRVDEAAVQARAAADHAGDGGLVRFRVMALSLLVRMLPPDQQEPVRERAQALASQLDDEDLLERLPRSG